VINDRCTFRNGCVGGVLLSTVTVDDSTGSPVPYYCVLSVHSSRPQLASI